MIQSVPPPWYEIPPLDFFSETLVPGKIRDVRTFDYQLRPQGVVPKDELLGQAESLRRGTQTSTGVARPSIGSTHRRRDRVLCRPREHPADRRLAASQFINFHRERLRGPGGTDLHSAAQHCSRGASVRRANLRSAALDAGGAGRTVERRFPAVFPVAFGRVNRKAVGWDQIA